MHHHRRRAFTIVELLVVVSIIGLLVGMLLPAVSKARDQARVTQSESNLRQLAAAHASYASEWNDRQFTLSLDDLSSYGDSVLAAAAAYRVQNRQLDPFTNEERSSGEFPIELGWTRSASSGAEGFLYMLRVSESFPRNLVLAQPIAFTSGGDPREEIPRFGWFRLPNAYKFSQYLSGHFYDPVFYAPKDTLVFEMRDEAADMPGDFTTLQVMQNEFGWSETDFCYSSYSPSPAALYSPDVMAHDDPTVTGDGFQDPWTVPGAFRAPSMSQALYSSQKTHMLEHHWLQKRRVDCNPNVTEERLRPYRDCQPYYFNQAKDSAPVTLFYDGHIELVGVAQAERADSTHEAQAGWGLWSRDTPFNDDGYWHGRGYRRSEDPADTSFHILTTDGIRGRDVIGGG